MLILQPVSLDEANEFVRQFHRHNAPVPGCKFCVGVSDGEHVCGVAIVGRPIARREDDGWTLEVVRTCTDGARNANSMLYGAAWRAAKALGYRRLVTASLPEESGSSLRAVGWRCLGLRGGGSWSRRTRLRVDKHPLQQKLKWEMTLEATHAD